MNATKMPTPVAEIHDLIGKELKWTYCKWFEFKTLFCESEQVVELLFDAAALTFSVFREVLSESLILSVCKLCTDPDKSPVKGEPPRENMSLSLLAKRIPAADSVLQSKVCRWVQRVKREAEGFEKHRHRRIGHHDYETRTKRTGLLPALSNEAMDRMLKRIGNVLNVVQKHYDGTWRNYAAAAATNGNALCLIAKLRNYREYVDSI